MASRRGVRRSGPLEPVGRLVRRAPRRPSASASSGAARSATVVSTPAAGFLGGVVAVKVSGGWDRCVAPLAHASARRAIAGDHASGGAQCSARARSSAARTGQRRKVAPDRLATRLSRAGPSTTSGARRSRRARRCSPRSCRSLRSSRRTRSARARKACRLPPSRRIARCPRGSSGRSIGRCERARDRQARDPRRASNGLA